MCINCCGYGFGIARLRSSSKEVSVMCQHYQLIQIWVTRRPREALKSCPILFFQEMLLCKLNSSFKETTADCRLPAIACEAGGQSGPTRTWCRGSKRHKGQVGWRVAQHSLWHCRPLLAAASPIYFCLLLCAMRKSRRGQDFTGQVWDWERIRFWDGILWKRLETRDKSTKP